MEKKEKIKLKKKKITITTEEEEEIKEEKKKEKEIEIENESSIYSKKNNNSSNKKEKDISSSNNENLSEKNDFEEDEEEKIKVTTIPIKTILSKNKIEKKNNKVISMIQKKSAFKLDNDILDNEIQNKKSQNLDIKRVTPYQKGDSTLITKKKFNEILYSNKDTNLKNIFPDDVEITKVHYDKYQKIKSKIPKKTVLQNLITIEKITPEIIKTFYENNKYKLKENITYDEMIKTFLFSKTEESKYFFDTFKLIDIQQNEDDKINVGDVLILLLNSTKLFYEEKFKFEFLVLDIDHTNYLSKKELIHLLELNFMTYVTKEVTKRFKLIVNEIKSLGFVDEETFDYNILLDILKKKPFLFFPFSQH